MQQTFLPTHPQGGLHSILQKHMERWSLDKVGTVVQSGSTLSSFITYVQSKDEGIAGHFCKVRPHM